MGPLSEITFIEDTVIPDAVNAENLNSIVACGQPAPLTSRLLDATGDKLPATADGSIYVDNSGTQRAVNTGVTPVAYAHGKAMHFNGSTSKLVFDSPVIGSTGTINGYLLTGSDVSSGQAVFNNEDTSANNGVRFDIYLGNISMRIAGASTNDTLSIKTGATANTCYKISVIMGTSYTVIVDGVATVINRAVSSFTSVTNLTIGNREDGAAPFGGSIILSHTSAIMTVAECLSWQNNPRNVPSQAVSATGTPNAIMQNPPSGSIFYPLCKEVTGTTGSTEGSSLIIAHGLTASKILFAIPTVNSTGSVWLNEGYTFDAGSQFNSGYDDTNIYVNNHPTNSENILSKPCKVSIFYKP